MNADEKAEIEKKIGKNLSLLPKLFALMDSSEEHEAIAALKSTRNALGSLNALQEQLTGQNPELSFAQLYGMMDAGGEIHPDEYHRVLEENALLRQANDEHAQAEQAYQARILGQEAVIKEKDALIAQLQRKPKFPDDDLFNGMNPSMHFTQKPAANTNSVTSMFNQNFAHMTHKKGPSPT